MTITITNAAPVANPDAYMWPGGATLVVAAPGVLANDTDADGDELIAELAGGGISGSFDLEEDGSLRYTPGGGFSGSGAVSYRVWDGLAWSATTTISLTEPATSTRRPTPTPTPRPAARSVPAPVAATAASAAAAIHRPATWSRAGADGAALLVGSAPNSADLKPRS